MPRQAQDSSVFFCAGASLDLAMDTFGEIDCCWWFLGRLFAPGEPDTMVVSHALLERRLGSDPHMIGRAVTVNGHEFTITGVLPRDFRFLFPQQTHSGDERRKIDAYIPLPEAALNFWQVTQQQWEKAAETVGPLPHAVCVVGKLKPNIPLEVARAEMETIYARVAQEHYPSLRRESVRLHIASLKDKLAGQARSALLVLLGAVGFVLLIAVATVRRGNSGINRVPSRHGHASPQGKLAPRRHVRHPCG
jgi:putative ABC transport system permease protein